MRTLLALFALVTTTSCFSAPAADVMFSCDPRDAPACPGGYTCESDGCCHRNGSDFNANEGACKLPTGSDSTTSPSTSTSGTTGTSPSTSPDASTTLVDSSATTDVTSGSEPTTSSDATGSSSDASTSGSPTNTAATTAMGGTDTEIVL